MRTSHGYTIMTADEFGPWLKKQKVWRSITKLQVHHTLAPDQKAFEKTDKRVYSDPYVGRNEAFDSYGKKTWHYADSKGCYIAQNLTIWPDGIIVTGRDLNSKPIGIKGWNTGAICCEVFGNFDKGRDTMPEAQRRAVITVYGEMCKRFGLKPSTKTIRYHCWFTADGTYLAGYNKYKSAKTCPGTAFFGGNTMKAYKENFLPVIKEYIAGNKEPAKFKSYLVRVTTDVLNIRRDATAKSDKMGEVRRGDVFTIVAEEGRWGYLKSGAGWIHLGYTERI